MSTDRGRRAEDAAARHLEKRGMRVIERNWRCPAGEIDIVCREGATVVFVEVKGRAEGAPVSGLESINRHKRRRISGAAAIYLTGLRGATPPARFDVVTVTLRADGRDEIDHLRDAFETEG